MLEQLLKMDLPDTYQDGFVKYTEKLDGYGITELIRSGIDKQRAKKMLLLCEIERMKSLIEEPNDFTEEELEYGKKRIAEEIEHYNNIKLN